ncbi:unnamed protein product [Sphenostylis stenocarpa]|uniref:Uncharacterized protein n=1 Tax=Sphenostylis stenocarpa TaxID=92480 RepID=A0AA86W2Q7_9FABA|nr:unnamed protein product [Sphenostylis stenocarpa]
MDEIEVNYVFHKSSVNNHTENITRDGSVDLFPEMGSTITDPIYVRNYENGSIPRIKNYQDQRVLTPDLIYSKRKIPKGCNGINLSQSWSPKHSQALTNPLFEGQMLGEVVQIYLPYPLLSQAQATIRTITV